jgi:hypothetical protein
MITTCTDAINYYNRVAYPFASICTQYFRLELSHLLVLFRVIQLMNLFLITLFGILTNSYSRDKDRLFQGIAQGNGTAPAL